LLLPQRCAIQAAGIGAGGSATTTRAGGSGTGAVWLDRWYISTLPLLPQQMHIHVIELGSNQDEPDHLAAWFRMIPRRRGGK